MAYTLENRLVVGIASSALFDLQEADQIFREKGEKAYREYQRENQEKILSKGVAFSFVKRLLSLNEIMDGNNSLVEVVLLSRNDPDTGLRVLKSIEHYGLAITRACFLQGKSPYSYIPAFNISLFLSGNKDDVDKAIEFGYPAGHVVASNVEEYDDEDKELRIGFDFDGVLINDVPEQVYEKEGLESFQKHEKDNKDTPHDAGPLSNFVRYLTYIQEYEQKYAKEHEDYKIKLRVGLITARSAPAHERVVTTMRSWGLNITEAFFLGGIDKIHVLNVFRPHMFFDDQLKHLEKAVRSVAAVHVPFGVRNK